MTTSILHGIKIFEQVHGAIQGSLKEIFKSNVEQRTYGRILDNRHHRITNSHIEPCNGGSRWGSGVSIELPPTPRFLISYENEIIWSQWDQIISFSWDIEEKWDKISKANPHTPLYILIWTPFPEILDSPLPWFRRAKETGSYQFWMSSKCWCHVVLPWSLA